MVDPVRSEVEVELHVDDAGFVRASPAWVYRRLVDVGSWPSWGMADRVRPLDTATPGSGWSVEMRGTIGRRRRWSARPHGHRVDVGFHAMVAGDLQGGLEFWLEPSNGGTVVHHLLRATTPLPHPARVLADHRRGVRRGLWGLRDVLHLEARTSAGLLP